MKGTLVSSHALSTSSRLVALVKMSVNHTQVKGHKCLTLLLKLRHLYSRSVFKYLLSFQCWEKLFTFSHAFYLLSLAGKFSFTVGNFFTFLLSSRLSCDIPLSTLSRGSRIRV